VRPPPSLDTATDQLPTLGELIDTLTLQAGYNTALVTLGTTLLGFAAGVIGVFALLRKRSLVTDALAHATLPGIALAFLGATVLGFDGRSLPVLLFGAAVTGTLGILCIQLILRHSRLHEDAAIGIVLSVFFGAGIVGLSYIQANAPSGAAGLNTLIYGQAAAIQPPDVLLMAGIALTAVLATLLLLKEFTLVCFNDAFAKVDGWPTNRIDLLMMALVVVVTVAGLQAVGLILVVAMLIIPPVAARFWTDRLWRLVAIAGFIGGLSGYLGAVTSALLPRKPAGAVIVLTAGAIFVLSLVLAPARGLMASGVRRLRLRLRIASDHLLETAHDRDASVLHADAIRELARTRGWSRPFRALVLASLRRSALTEPLSASASGVGLSDSGRRRGARVARNHALWEQYLVSHADVAPSHVDWSVDQVEHVLSDDLIEELEAELEKQGVDVPERSETRP
jgi:manganese/zinc/iron transport system permease protein